MDLSPLFGTRFSDPCDTDLIPAGRPRWLIEERELHPDIVVDLVIISENYIVVELRVRLVLLYPLLF